MIVPIYTGETLSFKLPPRVPTSVTWKVLEHIVHSSVMTLFDRFKILCDNQHGFHKKRSFETQLIVTIHEIAKHLSSDNQVVVILLDFKKAFDNVPHARLFHKPYFYDIRGNLDRFLSEWQKTDGSLQWLFNQQTLTFSQAFHRAPSLDHCFS